MIVAGEEKLLSTKLKTTEAREVECEAESRRGFGRRRSVRTEECELFQCFRSYLVFEVFCNGSYFPYEPQLQIVMLKSVSRRFFVPWA